MDSNSTATNQAVYSLAELSQRLKQAVEGFGVVRVRAEISGVSRPKSGHVYFALKDDNHVIDGVVWRSQLPRLNPKPEDGLEVIATGRLTTYSPRSRYQIIIESLEVAGEGAILRQLELRKQRLEKEGLFLPSRKKSLPSMPRVVGVITSPKGAVLRDILHRLAARFPLHVLLWPVSVQGEAAAGEVSRAIAGFNGMAVGGVVTDTGIVPRPQVLIVARGGGSLEDLMPFNDEGLVRAVAASAIPIVSAVGHETDTTLCDYAADMRAPTPTAAAEIIVPVLAEERRKLDMRAQALARRFSDSHTRFSERLVAYAKRLTSPAEAISQNRQQLHSAVLGLDRRFAASMGGWSERLATYSRMLVTPKRSLGESARQLTETSKRVHPSLMAVLGRKGDDYTRNSRLLDAHSYESILKRGFVLVMQRGSSTNLVKRASDTKPGQALDLRFADGVTPVKVDPDE